MWKEVLGISIESSSRFHIDSVIRDTNGLCFRFIGMYGNPDASQRFLTWQLLDRFGEGVRGPWLCGGDMNEILDNFEKHGGPPRGFEAMARFRWSLDYCALKDLSKDYNTFTWCNGHWDSADWWCSKHKAMLISFGQDVNQNGVGSRSRKHSRFHFEEAWCDEEECEMVVKDKWLDGLSCVTPTMLKAKNLSCGKGSHFTTIQPTLEKIEEVVQVLRSRVSDVMNEEDVVRAVKSMNPIKALWKNGLSALFYQKYWEITPGDMFVEFVLRLWKGAGFGKVGGAKRQLGICKIVCYIGLLVPSMDRALDWVAEYLHEFWDKTDGERLVEPKLKCKWQPPKMGGC
ncbi:hypothetical protein G4B88_005123 [Cannabis sativa]|uniref:Reverse transcriptase n=1 Tax=Cannabis sativa TaxID=3483 RepID=A0A7J6ESD3_CANSA|nr:hypothetical protein G4B88_005123 [Cannabis sativa]